MPLTSILLEVLSAFPSRRKTEGNPMRRLAGLAGRVKISDGVALRYFLLMSWEQRSSGLASNLPDGLADPHGDGQRQVEAAAAARHPDGQPRVGAVVDEIGHAGGLAAE